MKQLLDKGYAVHGTVRDSQSPSSVSHLLSLHGAPERLSLFSTGDLATATPETFHEAIQNCSSVFHVATPVNTLNPKFSDDFDGERDIYNPALSSTRALLQCIASHKEVVKCIVLTSSMSAVAPHPEPKVKDESCWSDSTRQKSRQNWYGATKTDQERFVQDWVHSSRENGVIDDQFRYAAICPTMIIGPGINNSPRAQVSGTMGTLLGWFRGKKTEAPNDSMSFIHVEDCAAMHIAAMEKMTTQPPKESDKVEGRYMSLIESWHWNDIATCLKELYPSMPEMKPFRGPEEIVTPTEFNCERMNSLGVDVRSVRESLEDSVRYFKLVGVLE